MSEAKQAGMDRAGELPVERRVAERRDAPAPPEVAVEQKAVAWGLLHIQDPELTNDEELAAYWKRKGRKVTALYAAPSQPEVLSISWPMPRYKLEQGNSRGYMDQNPDGDWCRWLDVHPNMSSPAVSEVANREPVTWQPIHTLPYSDDLVWLKSADTIEGPRAMETDDYDRYSEWAECTYPRSSPAVPVAAGLPASLVPNWAGEFTTFQQWVNKAQSWLESPSHRPSVCIDTKGRRCAIGKDFMLARDEGAFPVRFFWDFVEAAAPVLPAEQPSQPQDQSGSIRPLAEPAGQHDDDSAAKMKLMVTQSMADCMDMVRTDLIEMGIIDKSVAPMFIPEAVARHISSLKNNAAVEQSSTSGSAASGNTKPSCETCNDLGVVGGPVGQTAESFDYVTEDCPDCPSSPIAEPDTATQAPSESIDTPEFRSIMELAAAQFHRTEVFVQDLPSWPLIVSHIHSWHQRATQATKPLTDGDFDNFVYRLADAHDLVNNISRSGYMAELAFARAIRSHLKGD